MLLAELKAALKERIAEGANSAIRQLEEVLRPDADKFNEFVQIKGRYNAYLNAVVIGAASKAELDSQYNHISAALLIFTDSLRDEHLRTEQPAPGPAQAKRGELLYHIPHEMQTAHEYKCAVRVAYLRALLFEDWQAHDDDVQKSIPVAEIMSVELLNQDSGEPFAIRSFSDTIQFLDQDFHTEWEFYVKPRRTGAYPLLLKISVVETRNGRDVKRNIVLEERVVVSTDAPLEVETKFQKSDISLELRGEGREVRNEEPPTANSQQPAAKSQKSLRAMALFLAFLMLSSSAAWAFTPPATRDWWVAAVRDSAEGYADYIEKHRDTGPSNPRLETAYFRKAEKTDSLPDLRLYEERYPQGNYTPQVVEKIERHEVRAVASIRQQPDAAKVRQFLVDYPDARHLPEVKQTVEQLPAEQRTELLPAIETGYVRTMQAQPTAQKFEQYRQDYPRTSRLTEMAQAAATSPAALTAVQPALDEVIEQKMQAATTPAEVQTVLPALEAAGSARAAERVEQILEQKPAAVRRQVVAQVREVRERVEQREQALSPLPVGEGAGGGVEERDWQAATAANTLDAYAAFVNKYRNSAHRPEARQRVLALRPSMTPEEQAWADADLANTPEGYIYFVQKHLGSTRAEEARQRIKAFSLSVKDRKRLEAEAAERVRNEQAAEAENQRQQEAARQQEEQRRSEEAARQQREKAKSEAVPPSAPGGDGAGGGVGRKSGLTMIPVTGGTFTMGSPESERDRGDDECQHPVTVANFSIGQYEVTQADWREVMGKDPSYNKGCDDCPVEQVSWDDIQGFLKALNNREKASGKKYRLPTEAEWEYAARGGAKSKGYTYSGSNTVGEVAWYSSNSEAGNTFGSKKTTRPVGTKKANELGLYDMSGNVWEWCEDKYGPYPGCSEPESVSSSRVVRGGSWFNNTGFVRAAVRYWYLPTSRGIDGGFRLARTQ